MKTLMIVDENALHRRLYEKEFKKEGFSVLTTSSGMEALGWLDAKHPHLIILDPMVMSDMDGPEIMDRLLEREPRLPVVLNTSCDAFRNHPVADRAATYVLKSSNLEELKSTVKDILHEPKRNSLVVRRTA